MVKALLLKATRGVLRASVRTQLLPYRGSAMLHYCRRKAAHRWPELQFVTTYADRVRVTVKLSDHIESQLFWFGYQEADQGLLDLLRRELPSAGVFVDIGANIGSFSLVAARAMSAGRVIAFEPSPLHFRRLENNIEINGFSNITAINSGVGATGGEAVLSRPVSSAGINNSGTASLFGVEDATQEVVSETVSMVRLDEQLAGARVDAIKIDVEGAEMAVLRGAAATLERHRPVVYMEVDRENLARAGTSVGELFQFWESLDYRVETIRSDGGTRSVAGPDELRKHQNVRCSPAT